MSARKLLLLFSFVIGLFGLPTLVAAQEQPVVEAVLFHSPTCPHCVFVIDEVLPPLQAEYGDQLNIVLVNTLNKQGGTVFQRALNQYNVSATRRGVPLLIVADEVLVGSAEIPNQLPQLIETNLAANGAPLPTIAGLTAYIAANGDANPAARSEGFGIAALTLLLLTVSLGYAAWRMWSVRPSWQAVTPSTTPLIAILTVCGLLIAGYLSYVELTSSDAICGAIGSCNAVQESKWSSILGVPIALLGLIAYVAIGIGWLTQNRSQSPVIPAAMLLFALIGVLFSTYLTVLELFVIRAVCMWCIGSALVMASLLTLMVHQMVQAPMSARRRGRFA